MGACDDLILVDFLRQTVGERLFRGLCRVRSPIVAGRPGRGRPPRPGPGLDRKRRNLAGGRKKESTHDFLRDYGPDAGPTPHRLHHVVEIDPAPSPK